MLISSIKMGVLLNLDHLKRFLGRINIIITVKIELSNLFFLGTKEAYWPDYILIKRGRETPWTSSLRISFTVWGTSSRIKSPGSSSWLHLASLSALLLPSLQTWQRVQSQFFIIKFLILHSTLR